MQPLSGRQQDEVRALIALMKDPRYWRDQDPELLRTVRAGFRRIYLDGPPAGSRDGSLGAVVPRRVAALATRANAGCGRADAPPGTGPVIKRRAGPRRR